MVRPTPPEGIFELKSVTYAEDGICDEMTDIEMVQGRNNTGEVETILGSVPNATKENWLFCYFNKHIVYLTEMVNYLADQVEGRVV